MFQHVQLTCRYFLQLIAAAVLVEVTRPSSYITFEDKRTATITVKKKGSREKRPAAVGEDEELLLEPSPASGKLQQDGTLLRLDNFVSRWSSVKRVTVIARGELD